MVATMWLIFPWLLWGGLPCAEITLGVPATPGHAQITQGRSGKVPWSASAKLPTPWALVTLDANADQPDLDLEVGGGTSLQRSASHLPREHLLVRSSATPLKVRVTSPSSSQGRFRLGVTPLSVEGRLSLGKRRLRLEFKARAARLFSLPAERLRVELTRVEGKGNVDLLAFDAARAPLAIAEVRDSRELIVLPTRARYLIVLTRKASASAVLSLEAETKATPLDRFLDRLGSTPAQARAIVALRQNPDFLRVEAYLRAYPDGLPLRLRVVPGLLAHGVERFGTYSQGTLTINPTIKGHRRNPQELVDTLVHELIHALLALPRAEGFPLGKNVLDSSHDEHLRGIVGSPLRRSQIPPNVIRYLEAHYGPSASNPREDFTDLNSDAQELLVKVIRDVLQRSKAGRATLIFRNVEARRARDASVK
jgi:hypothetical protein